jgi:hypothetical protein
MTVFDRFDAGCGMCCTVHPRRLRVCINLESSPKENDDG